MDRIPAAIAFLIPRVACACGHDADTGRGGFLNQGFQLRRPEVGMGRFIAWREHAAGGGYLDHVGPVPDQLADLAPHLLDPIDDRVRHSRIRRKQVKGPARRHPPVTVTAGLGQHLQGDLQAGTGDEAFVDGLFDTQVGAPGIPHRGDSGPQRRLQVSGGLEEPVGERRLDNSPHVDVAEHHMDMCIEQARQEMQSGAIDGLVAVEARSHIENPTVLNNDISGGGNIRVCVEYGTPSKQEAGHQVLRPCSMKSTMLRVTSGRRSVGSLRAIKERAADIISSCRNRPARSGGYGRSVPDATPSM